MLDLAGPCAQSPCPTSTCPHPQDPGGPTPSPTPHVPHVPQHWPRPGTLACPTFCSPTHICPRRAGPEGPSNPTLCPVFTQLVITALKCHKYDKNIQVTGSAALFYLTNSEYRSEQSVKLRRQVIQVVLNGMESYQEVTVSPFLPRPCML